MVRSGQGWPLSMPSRPIRSRPAHEPLSPIPLSQHLLPLPLLPHLLALLLPPPSPRRSSSLPLISHLSTRCLPCRKRRRSRPPRIRIINGFVPRPKPLRLRALACPRAAPDSRAVVRSSATRYRPRHARPLVTSLFRGARNLGRLPPRSYGLPPSDSPIPSTTSRGSPPSSFPPTRPLTPPTRISRLSRIGTPTRSCPSPSGVAVDSPRRPTA